MSVKFEDKDLGFNQIKREMAELDNYYVGVGFPGDAENTQHKSGFNMASLALVHEFGTESGKIPARPFMKQTSKAFSKNVGALMTTLTRKVASGRLSAKKAHSQLGAYYEGKMKETITSGTFKPNAPATIKLKGSSKPLIDTGQMRASISHVVRKVGA